MVPVLLYYKFVDIDNPEEIKVWQREVAESFGLKGRILVGSEGVNGTVSGSEEGIEAYKRAMWSHPLFADMPFKESLAETTPFPKLKVKVRNEIISLHKEVDFKRRGGDYLDPQDLEDLYEKGEEFYVLDVRNNYETIDGTFEGAIVPDIENFRELPAALKEYAHLKDKKIVTVCTGGVRCEKASALLKEEGFADVYQLKDGIVNYIQQFPDSHYKGDCYVFDDRMRLSQREIAEHGTLVKAKA